MEPDALVIADRTFTSRLIVGTGKYPSHPVMSDAHAASATEMVTVAVRRVNVTDLSTEPLLHYIDTNRIFLLPADPPEQNACATDRFLNRHGA